MSASRLLPLLKAGTALAVPACSTLPNASATPTTVPASPTVSVVPATPSPSPTAPPPGDNSPVPTEYAVPDGGNQHVPEGSPILADHYPPSSGPHYPRVVQ